MEKNRSGSEGSWNVKLVLPSSASMLHYECYNISTPNTSQHPVSLSKTPQSAPNVTPSINTTIKPTSCSAMTPEDALLDMGYPKGKVSEMVKQARKNKEIREQLYLIVTRLLENGRFTWDSIEKSIKISKQRYQHWKKEFSKNKSGE